MRLSEFWRVMEETFGSAYARSLAQDQVLAALGGRSAVQALEAGVEPRAVWDAICDQAEVGDDVRWRYRDDSRAKRRGH